MNREELIEERAKALYEKLGRNWSYARNNMQDDFIKQATADIEWFIAHQSSLDDNKKFVTKCFCNWCDSNFDLELFEIVPNTDYPITCPVCGETYSLSVISIKLNEGE